MWSTSSIPQGNNIGRYAAVNIRASLSSEFNTRINAADEFHRLETLGPCLQILEKSRPDETNSPKNKPQTTTMWPMRTPPPGADDQGRHVVAKMTDGQLTAITDVDHSNHHTTASGSIISPSPSLPLPSLLSFSLSR